MSKRTHPFFVEKYDDLAKWDQRMIDLAFHVARWSKDPEKKVGAVVLGQDIRQIAFGYNGPPPYLNDDWVFGRSDKNRFIRHAEINALDNARFDTRDATLYATRPLCVGCATSLLAHGATRLVCPEIEAESSWYQDQSDAFDLVLRGNIEIVFWK